MPWQPVPWRGWGTGSGFLVWMIMMMMMMRMTRRSPSLRMRMRKTKAYCGPQGNTSSPVSCATNVDKKLIGSRASLHTSAGLYPPKRCSTLFL